MSPSHPHTVGAVASPLLRDEDEDNDICPVCDGECTCANKPRTLPTTTNATTNPSSSSTVAAPVSLSSPSTSLPAVAPRLPSLKIRLTIPPSMLGKRRASSNKSMGAGQTTSVSGADGGTSIPAPRPSTSYASQYGGAPKKRGRPPKSMPPSRQLGIKSGNDSLPFYRPSQPARRRKPTAPKKTGVPRIPDKLKGKATTVKKASASSKRRRLESSDSSSELSDVDHPYHYNDVNDDARSVQFPTFVSASALSSSSESDMVSLSGFDTDSSMEAEEENFIVAEESRGADKARVRRELLGEDGQKRRNPHNNWVIRPRKRSVGPSDVEMEVDTDATEYGEEEEEEEAEEDDDEVDVLPMGSGYIGVATGWSEAEDDQESSFDADLFFANLTDSDDDDDHSCPADENDERADDGDQSDLETMSLSEVDLAGLIPHLRRDLPFELTEGWDGQITFSNGLGEVGGLLDVDFEVNPGLVETSASPSQESDNEDMEHEEEDAYEGGDTTDEELVGEDHLPNEHAMRLFNLPFSVSSINPMSTMSPSASPAPRNRRPFGSQTNIDSPKPADILSGRVFLEESDNEDDYFNARSASSSRGGGPRTGSFTPAGETIRAVIDDTHAGIPSPHPRVRGRGRGKSTSHLGRTSPRHSVSTRQLSLPPMSQPSFQLLSSSELTTSPELPAQTIDLDDVLDSAFLDSEPSEGQTSVSPTEQSRKHLNLSRWGWGSDMPGSTADFGKVMRNSPLSSMLWQDGEVTAPSKRSQRVPRERDGDRTPTSATVHTQVPLQNEVPTKSRKETRRERKIKQKNVGLGYDRPPHQQHYFRQHHPNSKNRSSSSSQRTNFFNSSPPAPSMNT